MAKAGPRLEKLIRDRKMRQVATDIFKELQKKARVQNVYNDTELRQQLGEGVVALVNGEPISLSQLDEERIIRHGADVLQGLIGRRMLELDCAQHQVTVSSGKSTPRLRMRPRRRPSLFPTARPTSNAGLRPPPGSKAFLRRPTDAKWSGRLWPCENSRWARSTSPTKTSKRDSLRTTAPAFAAGQLSWTISAAPRKSGRPPAPRLDELKKKNANLETAADTFGELAGKYSIERSSRALQGQVPPIRQYGGQPELEKEAFTLKAGDLSGVIEVDDKYVILFCEGYTKPIDVKLAEVKKNIIEDIREKKERLAMHEYYDRLQDMTTVDNYLEPSASHSPRRDAGLQPVAGSAVPTSYNAPVPK